jgi:hypothetical protein
MSSGSDSQPERSTQPVEPSYRGADYRNDSPTTTEVVLFEEDGMPLACAVNFGHISSAQRDRIGPILSARFWNEDAWRCTPNRLQLRSRRHELPYQSSA